MLPELHDAVDDVVAIWSMWDGYLDRDSALVGALRVTATVGPPR